MKMDSFSPRRSYVPLRCDPDVLVLSAGPTRLKLAAPPYTFSTPVTLVLRQRLSRSPRNR
jgi:hypothetical protein